MPLLPNVLFVAFTVLAAVGAFLIGDRFRSRAAGGLAAALVLVFMVVLYVWVRWLLRSAGL
jgi:hypothetical protein